MDRCRGYLPRSDEIEGRHLSLPRLVAAVWKEGATFVDLSSIASPCRRDECSRKLGAASTLREIFHSGNAVKIAFIQWVIEDVLRPFPGFARTYRSSEANKYELGKWSSEQPPSETYQWPPVSRRTAYLLRALERCAIGDGRRSGDRQVMPRPQTQNPETRPR